MKSGCKEYGYSGCRVFLSVLLICISGCQNVYAQVSGSLKRLGDSCVQDSVQMSKHSPCDAHKLRFSRLIFPTVLLGTGIVALENDWLKYQNKEVRDELQENIDRRVSIDDFMQYVPIVSVYGLNLCGVKGKHGFRDATIILGTASLIMATTVNALKYTTRVERPDGSSNNSFPSGHTATAFMGAEFLRREYWNVSPWIGVAGYVAAAGTGYFRLHNNRHWLSDVLAGAGIGIISVEMAYWLYPKVSKWILPKRWENHVVLVPCVSSHQKGVTCNISF